MRRDESARRELSPPRIILDEKSYEPIFVRDALDSWRRCREGRRPPEIHMLPPLKAVIHMALCNFTTATKNIQETLYFVLTDTTERRANELRSV